MIKSDGVGHREFRGFGPPGTGKTHWLSRQIRRGHAHYGSADKLIVASFTKTAAKEVATRAELKNGRLFGTLHSICYQMLGQPEIIETKVGAWNEWVSDKNPSYQLSGEASGADEPEWSAGRRSAGDNALMMVNNLRARRVPREMWHGDSVSFWSLWSRFKDETEMVDFTDLTELPLSRDLPAPMGAECGFFDEVQDFTRLEIELVRSWARCLDYVVLVGDDDQCIYSFKGATPDAFLHPPIDDEHKTILKESRRVPRAVHALANDWITTVQKREPKEYSPRDHDGSVDLLDRATWRHPEPMIDDAEQELDAGRSVMILTSCSYHLAPTIAVLRRRGIPFHNPYRRKRGDWNPLRIGGARTSAADRLLAWLRASDDAWGDDWRFWTGLDLKAWTEQLTAKSLLVRGAKGKIEALADEHPDDDLSLVVDLAELFEDGADGLNDAWRAAMDLELSWIEGRLLASKQNAWRYPLQVAARRGPAVLRGEPRLIVGTIHSVKGGEADTVYVAPDLSPDGLREWSHRDERRDPIIRMFYVAFTRTRDRLVLLGRGSRVAVPWRL